MQMMPIDLTEVIAVVLGISIVLVPVIGLTARFALGPAVAALAQAFESRGADETLRIIERRMELQEQEIAMLTQTVHNLTEAQNFQRQLSKSTGPADDDTAASTSS
jgi:hypothetical protein